MFGAYGGHVNVTDGRYVYMRAPADETNQPLCEYTLMPTRMTRRFSVKALSSDRVSLSDGFSFTKGCSLLRVQGSPGRSRLQTQLFDLQNDPAELAPIQEDDVESRLAGQLGELMAGVDAPAEQYERLGIAKPVLAR